MINKIVKRFGLLLSSLGFIIFIYNIINNYVMTGKVNFVNCFNVVTLILSIIVLVTSFNKLGTYIQPGCLLVTSILTFYENPTQGSSILQLLLFLILAYKYNFLKSNLITKTLCVFFIYFFVFILSLLHNKLIPFDFIPISLLFIFFFTSLFIILKDEFVKYINYEIKFIKEIKLLKQQLSEKISEINSIKNDYVDPKESGLTVIEMELLKNLCLYKETNTDLALRLQKSPNTIKVQLTKIMIKIGAENRYQLIDLCKNYFIN